MAKQYTLQAAERLKSRKRINEVFQAGKRIHYGPLRMVYLLKDGSSDNSLQFGCTVSAKNFKKAVDRNRIKRLMREAYRLQKKELELLLQQQEKSLYVFAMYTGSGLPAFDMIKKALDANLKMLKDIIIKPEKLNDSSTNLKM